MKHLNKVYLLLGSNIVPRSAYLSQARYLIIARIGNTLKASSIYESQSVGFISDTMFYNQVLLIETVYSAKDILYKILEIEKQLGRVRSNTGYESRTIDIDILYFNDEIIVTDRLEIPHPRLAERKFTLLPLCEIASEYISPTMNITNSQLLDVCSDNSIVNQVKLPEDE